MSRPNLARAAAWGEGLLVPPRAADAPIMTGRPVELAPGHATDHLREDGYDLVYCFAAGHADMHARGAEAWWPFPVDQDRVVFLAAGVTHQLVNQGSHYLVGYAFAVPPRTETEDSERRPHKMTYSISRGRFEEESGRRCWQPVYKPNPASRVSAVELAEFHEHGRTVRHRSGSTEEIFYFVRGHGQVHLDDVTHEVGPGTAVLVPQSVAHEIVNTGPGLMSHFTVNTYLYGTDAE